MGHVRRLSSTPSTLYAIALLLAAACMALLVRALAVAQRQAGYKGVRRADEHAVVASAL